ncbi:MAG TPA: DUF6364 family protein [Cytophagales bacterium]|nr:DUF6364 family protein [Cytophagales bacterium]
MDTKLTIKLDKNVVERAKKYAIEHKISLSRMIQSYLDSVTRENLKEPEITSLVESLSGVIHLNPETDVKKEYQDFLIKKYQ